GRSAAALEVSPTPAALVEGTLCLVSLRHFDDGQVGHEWPRLRALQGTDIQPVVKVADPVRVALDAQEDRGRGRMKCLDLAHFDLERFSLGKRAAQRIQRLLLG